MKILLTVPFFIQSLGVIAQGKKLKVLFVGNSFVYTNDLPAMTAAAAKTSGDTLIYDSSAPGGHTMQQHTTNATTLSKIALGDWNYVVLQDQSQRPAFSDAQVALQVTPYARALDSLVHDKNVCGRSIFYMTWGYPDGDAGNCPVFPPICTYKGMDSLLNLRYSEMAIANKALLSPVGLVFNELIKTAPGINLFAPDRIHPSLAGTYAASLTFYTIIFRKDPVLVTYNPGLPPADADMIRKAAQKMVFTTLTKWHVGIYDPKAAFTFTQSGSTVTFNSSPSTNLIHYNWDFGDGNTSTLPNPVHTYTTKGTFKATLKGDNCILTNSANKDVVINTTAIQEIDNDAAFNIFPNPANSNLNISTKNNSAFADAVINISNPMGQQVLSVKLATTIDISELQNGVYYYTIVANDELKCSGKLVKQ